MLIRPHDYPLTKVYLDHAAMEHHHFHAHNRPNIAIPYNLVFSVKTHDVIPHESTIPTYIRYYPAVLSKFACYASRKLLKNYPFCVPGSFMERQEAVDIFCAKWVILRSSVYSLTIAREKGSNRDAQSQTANMKKSSSQD